MRYLFCLDAALAALGAVMTIAVGFVALVYGIYLDAAPKMRAGLPGVLVIAGCFAALAAVAGLATWSLWRKRRWHWWAQGMLAAALPPIYLIIYAHLQSP